jgi:hypothetical protein
MEIDGRKYVSLKDKLRTSSAVARYGKCGAFPCAFLHASVGLTGEL